MVRLVQQLTRLVTVRLPAILLFIIPATQAVAADGKVWELTMQDGMSAAIQVVVKKDDDGPAVWQGTEDRGAVRRVGRFKSREGGDCQELAISNVNKKPVYFEDAILGICHGKDFKIMADHKAQNIAEKVSRSRFFLPTGDVAAGKVWRFEEKSGFYPTYTAAYSFALNGADRANYRWHDDRAIGIVQPIKARTEVNEDCRVLVRASDVDGKPIDHKVMYCRERAGVWVFAREGTPLGIATDSIASELRKMLAATPGAVATAASPSRAAEPPAPTAQAFRHFTRAMEAMEEVGRGRGDEKLLLEALENAEEATLLDPSAAPYWHLLGHVYSSFKNDQLSSVMAEDALEKALSINVGNIASRLLLARLLMEREAYAKALDHLEWLVKKDPRLLSSALAADMCRAYVVDQQAGRGEKFFQETLKLRPDSSSIRLAVAILLNERGHTKEALSHLAVLTANPKAAPEDAQYARSLENAWRGKKL